MQGSRLVRDILGVAHKKPKGKDELAPEADDPPWPDVKVVVIVNKRSGSRVVRTRSKSNHTRTRGGGAEPALFLSFFASQPRPETRAEKNFFPARRASHAVSSDARGNPRALTLPRRSHRTTQGRQLARKLMEVRARPKTRPDRTRRVASPSGDISPRNNIADSVGVSRLGALSPETRSTVFFLFFFRDARETLGRRSRDARTTLTRLSPLVLPNDAHKNPSL